MCLRGLVEREGLVHKLAMAIFQPLRYQFAKLFIVVVSVHTSSRPLAVFVKRCWFDGSLL